MWHVKRKPCILEFSHKGYEALLWCYPKDLRADFGSEMLNIFDDQMAEAYSQSGFAGLLHVWFRVTCEIVTVALPGQLARRAVPVVVVTAALALMVWLAGYVGYVMESACPGCAH